MIRGTTPQCQIKYIDAEQQTIDLHGFYIYITIEDREHNEVTIEGTRITIEEDLSLTFTLTQDETLSLHGGLLSVQLRAIDEFGNAIGSKIKNCHMEDILYEGEISYKYANTNTE